ncbi:MAG TPA: hypothetical protein VKQ05_12935 [Gemmatimonadales bacterium]|nr:hypothetical protein [Gemmatimonadales bacterium]
MADNTVDLAVRWAEAGQDVPRRTAENLQNLQRSAEGAGTSIGDRLTGAFARFEARQPTMVIRRTALALEELAGSALGATGPVGRIAEALVGLGGAEGLLIAGGIAAIGLAWHEVSQEADLAASNVEAAAKRMHDAIGKAVAEHRGEGPEGRADFTRAIAEAQAKLAAIEASAVPAAVTRSIYTPYGYSTSVDTSAAEQRQQNIDNLKTLIGQLTAGLAELDNEANKTAEQGLRRVREEVDSLGASITQFVSSGQFQLAISSIAIPSLKDILGIPGGFSAASVGERKRADMDILGPIIGKSDIVEGKAALEKASRTDPREGREFERLAGALERGITMMASARSGNVGAAALGALGETATTASGLTKLFKLSTEDTKTLGLLGFGLSTASSLLSILGGHHHEVKINAFSEQALQQMRETRGDPLTMVLDIIAAIGASPRTMQQQLGRLSRAGVITRFP